MQTRRGNKSNHIRQQKEDYLSDKEWKEWRDLVKRYALAQLDYPEGLGMYRTLKIKKRLTSGWLHQIPPSEMRRLIHELHRAYYKLKRKQDNGEKIEPDILSPQEQNLAARRKRK